MFAVSFFFFSFFFYFHVLLTLHKNFSLPSTLISLTSCLLFFFSFPQFLQLYHIFHLHLSDLHVKFRPHLTFNRFFSYHIIQSFFWNWNFLVEWYSILVLYKKLLFQNMQVSSEKIYSNSNRYIFNQIISKVLFKILFILFKVLF